MKKETLLDLASWLLKWIWLAAPGVAAVTYYWFTSDLFLPILIFFLIINKALFDLYEVIGELKEKIEKDDKTWKSTLSRRKL